MWCLLQYQHCITCKEEHFQEDKNWGFFPRIVYVFLNFQKIPDDTGKNDNMFYLSKFKILEFRNYNNNWIFFCRMYCESVATVLEEFDLSIQKHLAACVTDGTSYSNIWYIGK